MAEMCRLLAFLLLWQSNCALFFVCSESRHSGCSSTIQFFWGNCLFWLVAVLVVALLAVILGFVPSPLNNPRIGFITKAQQGCRGDRKMKKESLIGLILLIAGLLLLAYQVYRFAVLESIFNLASIQAAQEAQLRLPLTPLFASVAIFAGVVLIVRDRDRAS
jgi:hypothetical protein